MSFVEFYVSLSKFLIAMRKIIALLFLAVTLNSCDDGDITLESFNFEEQNIVKCSNNNLLFKIKNDELLLVSLSDNDFAIAFEEASTPEGQPRVFNVNTNNKIIYRKYSDNLTNNSICTLIPPATPVVTKEWNASGGTIEVIATELFDETDGTSLGFTYNLVFQNVNFSSTEDSFSFTTYIFGDYQP